MARSGNGLVLITHAGLAMRRIEALDSMRGLAALAVVAGHCMSAFHSSHTVWDLTPLYFLWAGNEAVIFFFALSGFVLARPFLAGRATFTYGAFAVRRICRIYIPYLAVILLTFSLAYVVVKQPALGRFPWLADKWTTPLTPAAVVGHLGLIGNFDTNTYNSVIWSLVHEMRISLAFPIVLLAARRLSLTHLVALALAGGFVAGINNVVGAEPSAGFHNSWLYSLLFAPLFVMGAILARDADALVSRYTALPPSKRIALGVLALLVYCYARMLHLVPQKVGFATAASFLEPFEILPLGAASAVGIVAALAGLRGTAWLTQRPLVWIGQVSYSIYLVHLPILTLTVVALHSQPALVIVTTTVALTMIVAAILHRLVESPAARLGHRLAMVRLGGKPQLKLT